MLPKALPESPRQALFLSGDALSASKPCDLFRRVQKRNGIIVDFDPEKIAEAIFKAAQSVGGKDRSRAETLSEYVILDLSQRHQGATNLLNIEQIQDSVERVLLEKGHYRTGRAYITYRNERAKRRALRGENGFPYPIDGENEILRDTSVWISSGDSVRWDRERIVKALVRETNLPYKEARKVSHAVEMEIINSKISHLTASLIRELTNAQLLQMGYETERRLHTRLGLPIFDVEQRLLGEQEGEIRSIESEILRQFAAEKVLPLSVSEKHGLQDVHVHDLDLINKPIELRLDLDLDGAETWRIPHEVPGQEPSSGFEEFLTAWEREESRLLKVVGKRLVWENVNTALAFHAQGGGVAIRSAVERSLGKLWRLAGSGNSQPSVVWRLTESVQPKWKGKSIGARQLSLLPEDEMDTASLGALLEILGQAEEVGPYWAVCGTEFEIVFDAMNGRELPVDLVEAVARCLVAGVPLAVLFRRRTAVSDSRDTESGNLLQTISPNFIRAAALAHGDDSRLAEWLEDRIALLAQAHVSKRDLLTRMLKSGALAPLISPEKADVGGHRLNLDRAVFGVGIWGLEEMTRLHRGGSPFEDEDALRWLLGVLARLKLRMEEIGRRSGIEMRMVANSDEGVADRLVQSLSVTDVAVGCDSAPIDSIGESRSRERMVRVGKTHPFIAFGHEVLAVDRSVVEDSRSLVGLIQFLASSTHVQGMSLVGTFHCCRDCGTHSKDHHPPCRQCGSQSISEVTRTKRETYMKPVRH